MPRWRALPDELDPQVREFAEQLRRLVDRSGLSIAALADRTGYGKSSWERYLGGRLLAPKGAVIALAEVTGASPVHLTTMWELAERAWSRSELRHEMTMEAIRVSQERAGTEEPGATPTDRTGKTGKTGKRGVKTARKGGGGKAATPGIAGPAGVVPTVPPPTVPTAPGAPTVPTAPTVPGAPEADDAGTSGGRTANSWGLAGYQGPSPAGARAAGGTAATGAEGPGPAPVAAGSFGPAPVAAGPSGAAPDGVGSFGPHGEPPRAPRPTGPSGGRRRLVMFLAGMAGVLVVVAVALLLTHDGGKKSRTARGTPTPSATADRSLPPGVKCGGAGCTGKDAEAMGCTKDTEAVTTVKSATVGTTLVEVRYSTVCAAAWGRITAAAQGDRVTVTAGAKKASDGITTSGDTIAYTPMVAVKNPNAAKACVTLASGQQGCTP